MRHLVWRIVPLQCAAVSPIVIADRALRGRILQVLNAVKYVPNAATASESEALAWLMSRPPQLSALARAARCSVPATCADIERWCCAACIAVLHVILLVPQYFCSVAR